MYIYRYTDIYTQPNACTRSLARIATADAIGKQDTIPGDTTPVVPCASLAGSAQSGGEEVRCL
jgi:hypothetical protein